MQAGLGEGPEAISVVQIRDNEGPKSGGGREREGRGTRRPTGRVCSWLLLLEGDGRQAGILDNSQAPGQNPGECGSREVREGQVWEGR